MMRGKRVRWLGEFACACLTIGFFGLAGPEIVTHFLAQLAPEFARGIVGCLLVPTCFYMMCVGIPFGLHVCDLLVRWLFKEPHQKPNATYFALSLFSMLVITYIDLFAPTEITRIADLANMALPRFEFFYLSLVQGLPLLWFGYNLREWYESRHSGPLAFYAAQRARKLR